MPSKVTKTGITATYRYSADGVKLEAKIASGASSVPAGQPIAYAYLGSLVYSKVGGSYQLESTDFSGARYYNPTIARWTTIDPKAEKYYSTTPYSYCAGNPVMYVDPDGNKIRFAKGVSDDFKKSFAATVQYMNKKGSSGFNPVTKTIYWNNSEIVSSNGIWRSPATGLDHEVTHALRYDDSLKSDEAREEYKRNNEKGSDPEYDTIEEREVIVNREQATAQKHGEISSCSPEQIEQAIKDHNLYL